MLSGSVSRVKGLEDFFAEVPVAQAGIPIAVARERENAKERKRDTKTRGVHPLARWIVETLSAADAMGETHRRLKAFRPFALPCRTDFQPVLIAAPDWNSVLRAVGCLARLGYQSNVATTGAWSEGFVPLRWSRSTMASVQRRAKGSVARMWSIRSPSFFGKASIR